MGRNFLKETIPYLKPKEIEEPPRQIKQYTQRPCGRREHVQGATRRQMCPESK